MASSKRGRVLSLLKKTLLIMKRYLISFLSPEIQDERIEDVEQRSDSESVAIESFEKNTAHHETLFD
jgi:hypothetical protein